MKKQLPLFMATLAALFITPAASAQGGKVGTAVVSLQEEYDIVIDHAYNRDCPYYGLSSHFFDGEHLVAEGIKWASQQYLKYNVTDSVLLDSVSLKVRPHSQIDDYCFMDQNTVLVAANPSYERVLHDGILFWVDRNQRIVDTVSLYDFPVKTSRRPDITDPERMFVSYFRFPLVCKQDKIAVPMLHWGHSFPGCPTTA